jgi:uncharacterized protein
MEKRSQYIIQFASLPPGKHEYEFHITDEFFRNFEHSLVKTADVQVKAVLEKGVNNLQFTFGFSGSINAECVRCLDEFSIPVEEERHLLVRQIEQLTEEEEEEDIISIPLTDHEIDLAPHLYDYLSLMVPLNPVHPDKADGSSGCNENTLREMNAHLNSDANHDDPRWEILKKLKLK